MAESQSVARSEGDSSRAVRTTTVRGPFPWTPLFIAITAIAVVFGVWLLKRDQWQLPPSSTSRIEIRPSPNVVIAVRDLARLESVQFHMERVIELSDHQTHMFGLVRARDGILLVAVGEVTAGVDFSKLRDEDVTTNWTNRSVELMLPAPEIFHAALNNDQTRVYSRTTDGMADRREDLEERARREAELSMRRGAEEAGILTRAQTSTERAVRSLLHSLGFQEVRIRFRPAETT